MCGAAFAVAAMAQGRVVLPLTKHDFGVIHEAEGKVSCAMPVINGGDEPLVIAAVRASCGCTATDFPRTPIAPGDTAFVTITYNPAGRPGDFTKSVLIFTDVEPRRSQITITGTVIAAPESLDEHYPVAAGSLRLESANVPLGEVLRGKTRNAYIRGINASTDTIVVSVSGGGPAIDADAAPDTVPPAATVAVTVHYDAARAPLWGFHADSLHVSSVPLHGGAGTAAATVHVMAVVVEDFSKMTEQQRRSAPVATLSCDNRLNCGPLAAGVPSTCRFTVKNTGHDRLSLRRLWSPSRAVTATADRSEVKRGKEATITVTVDPALVDAPLLNTTLTVITNDPEHPRQVVRVVGEIINDSRQ